MENFIRNNCQLPVESTLFPMVVPCGEKVSFRWTSRWGYLNLSTLEDLSLRILKHDGSLLNGRTAHWEEYQTLPFTVNADDSISFECQLPFEGTYNLELFSGSTLAASAQLFAAEKDLFALRPYKGDFHTHSNGSDGKQSRAYTVLRSRQQGMDFTAITDHLSYCPEEEAQQLAADSGTGILVLPGEEIHLPCHPDAGFQSNFPWFNTPWVKKRTPIHLVNAGGKKSVNQLADQDPEHFTAEILKRCQLLPDTISPADKWNIASSNWVFEKIHEFGGLAIFPHPYWVIPGRMAVSDTVRNALFAERKFDAVETVNGCFGEESILNTAAYHSCIPDAAPVSGSDRHDFSKDDPLPFTIVFAQDLTADAIIDAVQKKMCCSATPIPGKLPLLTGDLRLVQYTLFLLKNYFPIHDQLCRNECMLRTMPGSDSGLLKNAAAETRKWTFRVFAGSISG